MFLFVCQIERDIKVGKINAAQGARQKKEILDALRKLGEKLTAEEDIYLRQFSDQGNSNFAKMNENSGRTLETQFSSTFL